MKKLVLLTDIVGIWVLNSDNGYKNLLKNFCKEHNIDFNKVLRIRGMFFRKYRKLARTGKLGYYELEEMFFKLIDKKNYKKLARDHIRFEIDNCNMY